MKKIKVISGIATFAVMALIFFFSSQTAADSSETSSGIASKIVGIITAVLGDGVADTVKWFIHVLVRKSAHFILYFTLGVSVVNTASQFFKKRDLYLFLMSFAFCIVYAVSDEIHQYFIPGRAAMFVDILIDGAGAFLGCILFVLIRKIVLRRKSNGL